MNLLVFVCAFSLVGRTHVVLAAILAAEPSAFVRALSWQRCPFLLTSRLEEWLARCLSNDAAHRISTPKSLTTGLHTLLSVGRLLSWYINLDPPFGLLLRCVAVQRPCDTKLKKDVSVLS